jgi:N-acyl-D-aspartate/D-glutamate deacylase
MNWLKPQLMNKNKRHIKPSVVFLSIAFIFTQCATKYDIVISGGTIYDGKGAPPYIADIGIKDGVIISVGKINPGSSRLIDASSLYVSPGFIDMHTHCDRGLARSDMSSALNYLTQGVTTVVTGNCGGGTYKVKEFFHQLDSIGIGPNVVHLIGHNTVRTAIMGYQDREPTAEELEQMKEMFAEGMKGGAVGFSTGLFYAPGSYSKTGEIIDLAKKIKEFNGIYSTHIRDESNYNIGLLASIKEAIEIGESAGIPVQISHIKALGKPVWNLSDEVCSVIEGARDRGVKVMADQYPYPASSTSLAAAVVPRWVEEGGKMNDRLADPELLPRIKKEMEGNIARRVGPDSLIISSFAENHAFDGKSLAEISDLMGLPVVETAIFLIQHGGPRVVSFNMNETDLLYFMKKDYIMTSSDGFVQVPNGTKTHPRSYGTFTRKIHKYVLEDQAITMEHAIRAATALPAEMLGLSDRGMIQVDYAADLVIFDPHELTDKATFDNPHQYSEGISYLIVNGKIVIENDTFNGTLAGKTIRMN